MIDPILILVLLVAFVITLLLNLAEIVGFYSATYFEGGSTIFSFDLDIKSGCVSTVPKIGPLNHYNESGTYRQLRAYSDESIPTFAYSDDFEGTIANVSMMKEIDQDSKMILWPIRFYSLEYLGKFWSKAVCTCPPCMASLHSLVAWAPIYLILSFQWYLIPLHLIYILCLGGLARLTVAKFDL